MYLFVSHYPLALYREQGDKLLAYVVAKGREGTAPLGALHESKGSSSCLATLLFMHQIEHMVGKKGNLSWSTCVYRKLLLHRTC